MARPSEKARSELNRFLASKKSSGAPEGRADRRRPPFSSVSSLTDCETHRRSTLSEISRFVSEIQNPSGNLADERIRDLNDKLNRLMREKRRWEILCRQLGGPDYGKQKIPQTGDAIEFEGFFYFGAAKFLPGIAELFRSRAAQKAAEGLKIPSSAINGKYFGFHEEKTQNKKLEEKLKRKQEENMKDARAMWEEKQQTGKRRKEENR